ncbi:MAG: hypothetical protein U9P73_09705 [Candidatus Cloacimonadota bacterium]|nr:hypothetical protein [Candidatus Cloacimonadota bacterium]
MNQWYSLDVGNRIEALKKIEHVKDIFWRTYQEKLCPDNMGIFTKYNEESDIVSVLFPPTAEQAANMAGAIKCKTPHREDLSPVAGSQPCLDILYQNKNEQ